MSSAPGPADTVGSNPNNTSGSTAPSQNDAPISGQDASKSKDGPSDAQPSETTGDPSSAPAPDAKLPDTGKPGDEPEVGSTGKDGKPVMPHTDSQREALVKKGEFPHDPNDHSGDPLKVHDGSEKKAAGGEDGDAPADDKGEGEAHESKGTGEKYVKSTGMAADGGDFDAVNPGAGAEATRLQEEKGIHHEKQQPGEPPAPAGAAGGDKDKVSKMQKIKDKLHIGSGKDLDNAK